MLLPGDGSHWPGDRRLTSPNAAISIKHKQIHVKIVLGLIRRKKNALVEGGTELKTLLSNDFGTEAAPIRKTIRCVAAAWSITKAAEKSLPVLPAPAGARPG
jgi:hypothetical protein